ncbi:Hypothetical predicted protein [Octopus vulgaris]|uniref:TRPM SLOG domain-containing protein n=1 Tax=Octopus vulgaris TaxID=6645 RepID=A0AA36FIF3_OCTVU|nr:Hypothetical predicted protein [Octopus vulgaris]
MSAWIISTGLHTGIEKHIGKTINSVGYRVVTIGIAPWNCVQNKESLVNKGSWPAKYEIKDDTDSTTSALDPNHSHFILVDDGTQETSGVEMEFRKMFENTITDLNIPETGFKVPAVAVMVGGELETLKSVSDSISRNIPVIIVKGTGQAADIMAYAYERVFGKLKEFMDLGSLQKLKTDIREKITEEFEGWNIKQINKLDNVMLFALKEGKTDIVELFLEYKINLKELLTETHIKTLFNMRSPENCQIWKISEQ